MSRRPASERERWNVPINATAAANIAVSSNPKMVGHAGKPADRDPIFNYHMSGDLTRIADDGVASNGGVVRDVYIGHEHVAVSNSRDAATTSCSDVQCYRLPNYVVISDDQFCFFALVFDVLGYASDDREGVEYVSISDGNAILNDDVADEPVV